MNTWEPITGLSGNQQPLRGLHESPESVMQIGLGLGLEGRLNHACQLLVGQLGTG